MAEPTLGFMSVEDELTLKPSRAFLQDWLLNRALQSFPERRGCASLRFFVPSTVGDWQEHVPNQPSLLFIAVPPHGIFVGYTDDDGETQWAPYDGSGTAELVDCYPDGQLREQLPVACFVDPDMAVRIVEEFCQLRRRPGVVPWAEMHQLGHAWG